MVAEQRRGRLAEDADPELLVELLYGPLYYRLLITQADLSDGYVDEIVAAVVGPLLR